jgi:hypothetical protein
MNPRPEDQLLGFHMAGLTTCPNMPIEEMSIGEGQRKEIY